MVTIEDLLKAEQKRRDAKAEYGIRDDQFHLLAKKYIEENAKVPEQNFAKVQWLRNGRKYSGVVFVTVNHLYMVGEDNYEVRPTFFKCEPIPADKDDGTGPHYYSEHWEKKRKFVAYDKLLSIEPYDAPTQKCGKCIWLHGRKEGDKLLSGCGINLGYKTDCGQGCACDRFSWWNWERRVGMTHYEYMMEQASNCQEETKDFA